MARFNGVVFGPGYRDSGTPLGFAADAEGIILDGGNDSVLAWSHLTIGKAGWDGARLNLEWQRDGAHYALIVADAAMAQALGALAGRQATPALGPGAATRAWSWGLISMTVGLPLLLLALLLATHERIAGWMVDLVSVEQEHSLGAQLFAQHKASLKLLQGPPQQMVVEIGKRLTQGSAYPYEFYVTEDKSVNAYAMPGGFIVVHSGLLALAGSADEVAGVLAHEVAHIERRHSLRSMAKSVGLYATVAIFLGDFRRLAGAAADLLNLKFSRDNERDADSAGLSLLVKAGLEPAPMAAFFRKMAAESVAVPAFLSTHPASEERFVDLDRAVKALPEAARAVAPLPIDYAAVKAALSKK